MFIENSPSYQGMRLFLTKIREEDDPEIIARMTRTNLTTEEDKAKGPKHLVVFHADMILHFIGAGQSYVTLA